MKTLFLLLAAMVLAFTVSLAPAHAHGDEKHGEATASAAPANDSEMQMEQMPGQHMDADHPMTGHDEASDGHHESDEGGGGFVDLLKSMHPATVHFPIALFLMAALTELFLVRKPDAELQSAVRVMIYGGAVGAVVAALFGWIHTGLWLGGEAGIQIHRWNGTFLAVAGVILAIIAAKTTLSRKALRIVLSAMAIALIVQGYLGAELAHGANHLGM